MSAALLHNALLFARQLRRAGIPVSPAQARAFVQALGWIDLGARDQVFYTARALLVSRHADLRLFGAIFDRFWRVPGPLSQRRQTMPRAPRHRPQEQPFTIATYMAYKARLHDPAVDITDRSGTASSQEQLRAQDFSQLTPAELEQVQRMIARLRWQVTARTTRRRRLARRGRQLALRAVVRNAARHGGVPTRLVWQRRTVKPRPLVILADISGSMERYTRLLLQLLHSASHALPRVECFVFGTRLTRLTGQLAPRNIDQALSQAAHEVLDWSGGTRIGASLAEFNRLWARRVLHGGPVVLLISDGWEQGEPAALADAVARIQRRCHRLIWLNPHRGAANYQPAVRGMRAALAHVDDFLAIDSLNSLEVLMDHLGSLPSRRSR